MKIIMYSLAVVVLMNDWVLVVVHVPSSSSCSMPQVRLKVKLVHELPGDNLRVLGVSTDDSLCVVVKKGVCTAVSNKETAQWLSAADAGEGRPPHYCHHEAHPSHARLIHDVV